MQRKRFSEDQIIGILREQEAGAKAADLGRKHAMLDKAALKGLLAKIVGLAAELTCARRPACRSRRKRR